MMIVGYNHKQVKGMAREAKAVLVDREDPVVDAMEVVRYYYYYYK